MTKPMIGMGVPYGMLHLHQYSRYLPTAFDESLTLIQKVNAVIENMDRIGLATNELIDNWNKVQDWILNEGLEQSIIDRINEMYEDGTLAKIINEQIFKMKLDTEIFEKVQVVVKITNPSDITQDVKNALAKIPNGGEIFIPYGDWTMHGYAELQSNQSVKAHKGTIIRKTLASNSAYSFLAGKTNAFAGYGGGAKNIRIEGLTFIGKPNDANTYYANGLAFHHTSVLHIVDCRFEDGMFAGHYIDLAGCDNVMIERCDFVGQYRISGREYAEAIQIDSSAPSSIGSDWGGLDALPTKNVTVQFCNFVPSFGSSGDMKAYAPNPIGSHGFTGGLYYDNINFIYNYVQDVAPTADNWRGWIHFYGLANGKFEHNTFKNTRNISANVFSFINSSGGRYDRGTLLAGTGTPMPCKNIDVNNNLFEGFTNTELQTLIKSYGTNYEGVYYPVEKYRINDNTFDRCGNPNQTVDTGSTLIQIYRAEDITITGNDSYLGNALASVWDSNHVTVTDNTAEKMAGSTVFVSNVTNVNVHGNRSKESRRQLEIQECTVVSVTGNTSIDTIQENDTAFANKFRNLNGATIANNVAHAKGTWMNYGHYLYQTNENPSSGVRFTDNLAVNHQVSHTSKTGIINDYIER